MFTTTCVTDSKGQSVEYEHDTLRRVVKVKTTDGSREFRNEYTYDQTRGLLTGVKHNTDATADNDVSYTFEYDALGRKTKVKVGGTTLSTNVYQNDPAQEHYGTLSQMQYGNGTVVRNEYDDFNRVTGVKYDSEDDPRYEYTYNANGQVAHVRNNLIGQIAESEYDLSNRPCRVKTHKFTEDTAGNVTNQEHVYTGEVAYDDVFGRLSKFTEQVGDDHEEFVTTFGYDDENRPTALEYGDYGESTLEYDGLGRVAKATVKAGDGTANTTTYTYVAGAPLADVTDKTSTTGLVKSISQTGGSFTYCYDDNGNISKVVQDGVETAYTYDALGQLIRVDDGQENATWVYTYDQGGNILSKKKYALGVTSGTAAESKTFTYGNANWRDQLTAVNGVPITYDAIGNPLNDGTWTYTWENGRQLARMLGIDTDASFVYNENGLRVQKTVNGVVTNYTLHGKNIHHMTQGDNELHFFYDAQNKPAVVVYNGTPYTYVKNLQGDIIAILDSNKNVVVSYVYDAWGRPISCSGTMASTLGKINPFRYRGYVYDEETGLYYLRSRYFNVAIVRFINADSILSDANMYCYCKNNAINSKDPNGFDGEPLVSDQLEPFKRTNWGSHDTPVPASIVIKNAITMAQEGDWMYEYGKLRYDANGEKRVDCISVITISAKFHMTWRTFTKVYNVRNNTGGSIRNHTASGKTTPIYDISLLKPGSILFNKSESHAGIYIGYYNDGQGTEYLHAVIQAQSPDGDGAGKVIVHDFSDPACTYVSYAEFNYIDYDITYADTLISNDFSATKDPSAYE